MRSSTCPACTVSRRTGEPGDGGHGVGRSHAAGHGGLVVPVRRLLTIDPSLTRTGRAWTASDGTMAVDSLPTGKLDMAGMRRIQYVVDAVMDLVADVAPDVVVIETMMLSKQGGGAETAWLHGVLRWELHRAGLFPVVEVAGASRQKWACGHQADRGKDAVLVAAVRAGMPVQNNDQADAAWFYDMAQVAYSPAPGDLPRYRLEVLGAIAWPEVDGYLPDWPRLIKQHKKTRPSKAEEL